MKQADTRGEDLVEAAFAEVDVLERTDEELGRARLDESPVAAGRRLDHFADRSIAVSFPPFRRSHTSVAAIPCPQPISSTRSPGRMSS